MLGFLALSTLPLALIASFGLCSLLGKQNILSTEYLPGRYTDLTWLKHKHSLHYAPNHESLDFFRGFHMSDLGMDIGYTRAQTSEILWKV